MPKTQVFSDITSDIMISCAISPCLKLISRYIPLPKHATIRYSKKTCALVIHSAATSASPHRPHVAHCLWCKVPNESACGMVDIPKPPGHMPSAHTSAAGCMPYNERTCSAHTPPHASMPSAQCERRVRQGRLADWGAVGRTGMLPPLQGGVLDNLARACRNGCRACTCMPVCTTCTTSATGFDPSQNLTPL